MLGVVAGSILLLLLLSSTSEQADAEAQQQMLSVVTHRPSPSSWRRTQCGWRNGEHLNHSANPAWPVHAHADADIPTRWGRLVSADAMPLPEYPRPQLVRGHYAVGANATLLRDAGDPGRWANLNGLWEWEPATPGNSTAGTFEGYPPFDRPLNSSILVPFTAITTTASVDFSADRNDATWTLGVGLH